MDVEDLLKSGKYEEYYSAMNRKHKKGEVTQSDLQKAAKILSSYKKVKLFRTKDPKDLYAVLEVPRTATQDEIKKAYGRLTRLYHPDANKIKESAECFAMINNAYSVLGDEKKRRDYDLKAYWNRPGRVNASNRRNTCSADGPRNVRYNYHSQRWERGAPSAEDVFYEFFSNFNDTSRTFRFGNGVTRNRHPFTESIFNTGPNSSFDANFRSFFQPPSGNSAENGSEIEIDPLTVLKIIILIFIVFFTCIL